MEELASHLPPSSVGLTEASGTEGGLPSSAPRGTSDAGRCMVPTVATTSPTTGSSVRMAMGPPSTYVVRGRCVAVLTMASPSPLSTMATTSPEAPVGRKALVVTEAGTVQPRGIVDGPATTRICSAAADGSTMGSSRITGTPLTGREVVRSATDA